MFQGVFVAIITPFESSDGKVDYAALTDLVEYQIDQGVDGVVPCGTTGESATLTFEEHKRVIETVVQAADGRCQVVAGTGSNSTRETVEMTAHAKEAGVDGALVITPYYNKPTQDGLYRHFKAVADAVDLPIMMYNVPGRTCVNMVPETVARLAELNNIVAIKEASGNLAQVSRITRTTDLDVLSGDDVLTLPLLSLGGIGVVSVVANLVPATMVELCAHWFEGDYKEALAVHHRLQPLAEAMLTVATNPIAVKAALKLLGRGNGALRLPLCEATPEAIDQVNTALTEFGMTT